MFRHLLLAGSLLLPPLMAQAESAAATSEPLTFTQALEATRQNHPTLKAIEAELGLFDARVGLARLKPPTRIGLEVENFAGSDELSAFDGAEITLSLSKVLELGDKAEARVVLAGSQNDLRRVELAQQRRDILADTAQRFIDVAIAQAEVAQAEKARGLAAATRKASQRRADAGAAPATELQRARLRLKDAELTLLLARKKTQSAARALALATGQSDTLLIVQAQPLTLPTLVPLAQLLARADQLAAVQSEDARLRIAEAELRLAQAATRADLALSGGIRHFEASGDQALVVGMSMPFGSRQRAEPSRLMAVGQQQAVEQRRQAASLRVKGLINDAWARLAAFRSEVEVLQESLQAEADAVVKATEAGYRRGRYSLLELNAAQADALNLSQRRLQAAAGFHRTLIEIERLVGDGAVKEVES